MPGGGVSPRILNTGLFMMLLVAAVTLMVNVLMPIPSEAAASPCAVEFHKMVLSLAIEYSPRDLKNSIRVQETPMHKRVEQLQNAPAMAGTYRAAYDEIVALATEGNRRKYPEMADRLADISMFVFVRYAAPDLDKYCAANSLAKQASFLYDGPDLEPDYSASTFNMNISGDDRPGNRLSVLQSFNTMVNETLDLWAVLWKASGRSLSGLPESLTLVRGAGNPPFLSFMSVDQARHLARNALSTPDYGLAVSILTEILAEVPDDKTTLYDLAVAQYQTHMDRESLANFRKVADMENAGFYIGVLSHRQGDESTSTADQMKYYFEGFRLLGETQKAGGEHAEEALKMLRETSEHLVELYTGSITDELKDVERQLQLAELSHSKSHQKELEEMLSRTGTMVDEYNTVRSVISELGLMSGTTKDFDPTMEELRRRASRITAQPEAVKKAESRREAPVERARSAPAPERKASAKPVVAEKKADRPSPPETPVRKKSSETADKREDAGSSASSDSADDRYRKFYLYIKANDMVPAIDAFKAGYNGDSCDQLRSMYETQFKNIASDADARGWAERQQSYCLTGKLERDRGTKYYAGLSEFLNSLESR